MTAVDLLLRLRRSGVVLAIEDNNLAYEGPDQALPPDVEGAIRSCKSDLVRLVETVWWPADRPRPNLYDLGNSHCAATVRAALDQVGCDLEERLPSWEELYCAAEALGWKGSTHIGVIDVAAVRSAAPGLEDSRPTFVRPRARDRLPRLANEEQKPLFAMPEVSQ